MSLNPKKIFARRHPGPVLVPIDLDNCPEDILHDGHDHPEDSLEGPAPRAKHMLHGTLLEKFKLIQPLVTKFIGDEYKLGTGLFFGLYSGAKGSRWGVHEQAGGWGGLKRRTQPIKLVIVNQERFKKFGFQCKMAAPLLEGESVNSLPRAPNLSYWLPGGEHNVFVTLQLPAVEHALLRMEPIFEKEGEKLLPPAIQEAVTLYEVYCRKIILVHCDTSMFEGEVTEDE